MRDVEQVMRFYIIGKRIGYRSIESLMDNPNWNPLLVKVVKDLKAHPDYGIERCKEIKRSIEAKTFIFKWNPRDIMSINEEELPRGTVLEAFELKEIVNEIENYLKDYKTLKVI